MTAGRVDGIIIHPATKDERKPPPGFSLSRNSDGATRCDD